MPMCPLSVVPYLKPMALTTTTSALLCTAVDVSMLTVSVIVNAHLWTIMNNDPMSIMCLLIWGLCFYLF